MEAVRNIILACVSFLLGILLVVAILFSLNSYYGHSYSFNLYKQPKLENKIVKLSKSEPILAKKTDKEGALVYKYNYRTYESTTFRYIDDGDESALQRNKSHVVLLGGSFAWGDGLADNKTLQSQIIRGNKEVKVFNFSIRGGGPSSMLSQLELLPVEKLVKPKNGHIIYIMMNDHIGRTSGDIRHMIDMFDEPYYYLDSENLLVHGGTFLSGRPIQTFIYRFLSNFNFLREKEITFPFLNPKESHKTTCAVIEALKLKLQKRLPKSKFSVLIFPGNYESAGFVKSCFIPKQIASLDYSRLIDGVDGEFYIPGDGHPNALLMKKIYDELMKSLEL